MTISALRETAWDPGEKKNPGAVDKAGIPSEDKLVALYQCSYPACMLSHFSHIQLCDPMDCDPSGSSVHGILQAKYWSGLLCPPPGALPYSGIELTSHYVSCIAGGFFTTSTTWESLFIGRAG